MRRWLCPPSSVSADLAVVHVEMRPVFAQFADAIGHFAYDHIDDLRIAKSFAGGDRVGRVTAEVIQRIEDAGNSPLGVGAVGLQQPVFGNDDHFQPRGNGQCRANAGDPSADNQHVRKRVRDAFRIEPDQVAAFGGNRSARHEFL